MLANAGELAEWSACDPHRHLPAAEARVGAALVTRVAGSGREGGEGLREEGRGSWSGSGREERKGGGSREWEREGGEGFVDGRVRSEVHCRHFSGVGGGLPDIL